MSSSITNRLTDRHAFRGRIERISYRVASSLLNKIDTKYRYTNCFTVRKINNVLNQQTDTYLEEG